jgi:dTDP-4-amino-4,6-dideoxygalactose transaminase
MSNAFDVVRQFETSLCDYTGAPYAVTTTSCTSALLLALLWFKRKHGTQTVTVPRKTYIGVGMSVVNAGHEIAFKDEAWLGEYQLDPFPLWDAARWMTSGIWKPGRFTCLSFHWSKQLGISQGGAILHDDPEADAFLRRARFDGRREGVHPKDDCFDIIGHHVYMAPATAAEGLTRLPLLPKHNAPLPNSDYPDLSQAPCFQRVNAGANQRTIAA